MYGYNTCGYNNTGNGSGYALILVLFILLAIIGSAWYAAR
ncbi:MAG: YjcZ family sporulation protein [Acholeplasmataceae bacterium]|nr:YjcZ family sporulation protein [Acholeplasmataceae bacterium]